MAKKNRIGLQFKGWEETIEKLDRIGGTDAIKRGVAAGLIESKKYINPIIKKNIAAAKLPAKGKFSHGGTELSIDDDLTIDWNALTGSIKIGFDFKKSGLKSIVLMYGTPRMKPAKGLKSAIYGSKTKKEIAAIQEEAVNKVIDRIMGG